MIGIVKDRHGKVGEIVAVCIMVRKQRLSVTWLGVLADL